MLYRSLTGSEVILRDDSTQFYLFLLVLLGYAMSACLYQHFDDKTSMATM